MTQVLIVGAGPVGLMLAVELARFGVAVRIIDQSSHATETSKALVVWPRTLELLERAGCATAFLAEGLRAHGMAIRQSGEVLGRASFDVIASAYNFALMIPQSTTERLLAQQLRSFGVEVERSVQLGGFVQEVGKVVARLSHADGRSETVEAPWLVGCDGAHSTVRHDLGMTFPGSAQRDEWLLADIRLVGEHAPVADEIAIYLHRDGPFALFPLPGGRVRVIADVGTAGASPPEDPTIKDVQFLIDARTGGGFRAVDPIWLTHFRISERKVIDYRAGRVFLAGDAAHVHSPAGGQGMNTGLQDAINLAWRLAMVTRGDAASTLLDTYSAERSVVADMVLRNAGGLTSLGTLSNPAGQAVRNVVARFALKTRIVQHKLAATMSEIEIGYPQSPLSKGRGAGARLPPDFYDGPPPGSGRKPRFVLHAPDNAKARALVENFPTLLEPQVRAPVPGSALSIVRPDAYAGFSGREDEWTEASAYLSQLAQPQVKAVLSQ